MHFLVICLLSTLALFVANAAEVERKPDKDMNLKVKRPDGTRFLALRCSMIPYRTYLSSVSKVEIFAADEIDGETSKFHRLAVIKKGWCSPRVTSRAEGKGIATGEIREDREEMTYLEFTWSAETGGYCKAYECVATGEDHNGNPTTIFTVNRVKSMENKVCTSDNSGCICQ